MSLDSNYLTRRIRRDVTGPTLDAVQQKQMTMPFLIPWALETYLVSGWCRDHIFVNVRTYLLS